MTHDLFYLAWQGIRRKKQSSLLLFLILFFSFASAVVTVSVAGSLAATNETYRYETYGTWYGAVLDAGEGDGAFLAECTQGGAVSEIGVSESYGTLAGADVKIGTADGTFVKIGGLSVQSGRLPEAAGEIAVEADALSALGYDYTVGQEIACTVEFEKDGETIGVEQTFTLCGVLREYTDLWNVQNAREENCLNAAIVTEETAEALVQAAENAAAEAENAGGTDNAAEGDSAWQPAVTENLFFSKAADADGDALKEQMRQYLSANAPAGTAKFKF